MKRRRVVQVDQDMMARRARTERVAAKKPTLTTKLAEIDFRCVLAGRAAQVA
jgi:hypothetical protein